jgi:hypothetical protein
MALDEEQSSAAQEMRRAIDCLRDCADLAEVDPATLEALAAGAVHFSLPAGSLLFESGSTPDGVYLVASGRLGVKTPVDLLNWRAFDRVIQAGYDYARATLDALPAIPRLPRPTQRRATPWRRN